ncbi:MAG: EAL domain-containing protein [Pseudomonadota bacterium]
MTFLLLLLYAGLGAAAAWAALSQPSVDPPMAAGAGVGVFLVLSVLHLFGTRGGGNGGGEVQSRLDALEASQKDAGERLNVAEARADAVEATVRHELTERSDALVVEMKQLEGLIARLAANFEAGGRSRGSNGPASSPAEDAALAEVRDALKNGRVDLHLQPVVSLPQRRVAFYEGLSRLRRANGELIPPTEFLDTARRAGLSGAVDTMAVYRCLQIVRRLAERDRRVGVFCNISAASLADGGFAQFRDMMATNRDLSGALIFELGADQFENRSRAMRDAMDDLSALGFRFSLDQARDIAFDLPRLQDAGVRFVKVEGASLLTQLRDPSGPRPASSLQNRITGEDVASAFSRYGVTLVADRVEDEATVVELLDYDVPYAQGAVFGAPRPIKASLMRETAPPAQLMQGLANLH